MDRSVTIALSIVLGIGGMAAVAIYGFNAMGMSSTVDELVPKSLEIVSTDNGERLHVSIRLSNMGKGTIDAAEASAMIIPDALDGADSGPVSVHFPLDTNARESGDGNVISPFGSLSIRGIVQNGYMGSTEMLPPMEAGTRCPDDDNTATQRLRGGSEYITDESPIVPGPVSSGTPEPKGNRPVGGNKPAEDNAPDRRFDTSPLVPVSGPRTTPDPAEEDPAGDGGSGTSQPTVKSPSDGVAGYCATKLGVHPGDEVLVNLSVTFMDGDTMEKIMKIIVK